MATAQSKLDPAHALASVAYLSLAAQGKARRPSLHDITVAVERAAPLLDNAIPFDQAVGIEVQAIEILIARRKWISRQVAKTV